jgi:hypothetical protein
MEDFLKVLTVTASSDSSKVLAGAFASLLPFWLNRWYKIKSEKRALYIEMENIYDRSNVILKLINCDSLPDNTLYREFNQINVSFKTPVIDSSYDKIDLLPKVVVESIVKISIIIDDLNDAFKKYERNFIEPQMLFARNDEIKPLLIQLNLLLDKALIKLK